MIVLALVACLLYAVLIANLADSRIGDVGHGMAAAIAVIYGAELWLALAIMLLVANFKGNMPRWAALGALILVPLSACTALVSIEMYTRDGGWPIIVPTVLPPLFAFYALWARIPALNRLLPLKLTSVIVGNAILLLTVVPLVAAFAYFTGEPERRSHFDVTYRDYLEKQERAMEAVRARDAAKFAALNENSSLRDYVDYFTGPSAQQAIARARKVRSRHDDAIALLEEGKLIRMRELWQLDVTPSAALCDAYRGALRSETERIDRTRAGYTSVATDLEFQLPNLRWLITARCDLSSVLADTAVRIRAVAGSPRPEAFAATLDELSRQ
jgi:hypothetical protein